MATDRFVSHVAVQLVWRAFSVHASRWPNVTAWPGGEVAQPRKPPPDLGTTVHDAAITECQPT
jgi:hypothetical protein